MLIINRTVSLPLSGSNAAGVLSLPPQATGLVVFAQAEPGSRLSSRCRHITEQLLASDLGTLCVDLLTPVESRLSSQRNDTSLLAGRLRGVCRWVQQQPELHNHCLGLLASGAMTAAALEIAGGGEVGAVVTFARHPELAPDLLGQVQAPTLLLVGTAGEPETPQAEEPPALRKPSKLRCISAADPLFQEAGALELAVHAAADWYHRNLSRARVKQRTPSAYQRRAA